MANIVFSRLEGYNALIPQNVLFGRFVEQMLTPEFFSFQYAKRAENTAFIPSRYPSYSLRGNGPSSAFLQQAQASLVASTLCQDSASKGRLSSFRSDSGSTVCDHGGAPENQQDGDLAIQWSIFFFVRGSAT